jgi:hypothetical protein
MGNRLNIDSMKTATLNLIEFNELRRPRYRQISLIIAVMLLAGGVVAAIRQQPDIFIDLDWRPTLLVMAICIPITVCCGSIVFMLTGRLVGQAVPFVKALEVTIIGNAANMLPLPGSTLVRVASLKMGGGGYKDATAAVLLVTATWIGVSLAYAAVAILFVTPHILGLVFLVVGLAVLSFSGFAIWRTAGGLGPVFSIVIVKLIIVVTDAARLFLCLSAIGAMATFAQASALTLSAVAGSAISIVPAGLGVREIAAAALSPIVNLALASGFLAATLSRVLAFVMIAPVGIFLAIRTRARERTEQVSVE